MSDIIAQLEVLSRESGCLIDLSAILDLSICPKIDIRTDKGHMVEQKDDYICVTPTNPRHDGDNNGDCHDECSEGGHNGGNKGGNKKGTQGLIDLDVGGKKDDKQALIDIDALTHSKRTYTHPHGGNRLLDVDVGGKKDKDQAAIDVDVATHDKRCDNHDDDHCSHGGHGDHGHDNGNGNDGLVDVDVGGEKDDKNALVDIDALTNGGKGGKSQGLLDIDVGGKEDDKEALIDIDALTHSKRCHSCDEDNDGGNDDGNGGNKGGNQGLIDLDVGGEKDDDEALIDADILTDDGKPNSGGNSGNNDNDEGNDGLGGLLDVNVGGEKGDGNSLINADVLTNDGNGGLLSGLLDLNVGGEKGDGNSLINADVLTNNKVKRCDSGHCYEVRKDEVCRKNHVALDLELLVVLELLTEKELEDYLKKCGEMEEDDSLEMDDDNVLVDPLLSLGVGEDDSLLNLDVGGEDGLLNLDLLGEDGLLNIDGLLNLNLRRRGNSGNDRLLDVDVGGKKDKNQADIDVDVLTHEKRTGKDGLLDLQVGGYADEDESTIDVDLLTKPRPSNGNGGNKPGHSHGHHLSHYQPMCGKAIKPKPGRDHTDSCHARDVNHCLAICHSKSALLTLEANVADIILICAAIQFDDHKSDSEDNCHFFSAPEHQPCEEDEMEDKDDCYTFVRN